MIRTPSKAWNKQGKELRRQFQETIMDDNQSLEEFFASIKSQWAKLRDICQVQHVIHPYGVKWAMKIVRNAIPNDLKQAFSLSRAQVILYDEADNLDYVLDMILYFWPAEKIEGVHQMKGSRWKKLLSY